MPGWSMRSAFWPCCWREASSSCDRVFSRFVGLVGLVALRCVHGGLFADCGFLFGSFVPAWLFQMEGPHRHTGGERGDLAAVRHGVVACLGRCARRGDGLRASLCAAAHGAGAGGGRSGGDGGMGGASDGGSLVMEIKTIAARRRFDTLVIGAGGGGLRAALQLSLAEATVAGVSKVFPTRSHTVAAQGGVNAARGNVSPDNWHWHMYDTVKGSDYLGDQDAIEYKCRAASRLVVELEHAGVPFSRLANGKFYQRAFGGQSQKFGGDQAARTRAAADRTGHAFLHSLYQQNIRAKTHFFDEFYAIDLIKDDDGYILGAVVLEIETGEPLVIEAKTTLIATGGVGRIFRTNTNARINTGDGMGMVLRAGIPLEDMEFFQFHPTGIVGKGMLISEAVRGEGGYLINKDGERFMERYAPKAKDLASRDVVSRAIATEVGECACVSVHGANRLGGNSLLDIVVFGRAAGNRIIEYLSEQRYHRPVNDGAVERALTRLARWERRGDGETVAKVRDDLQRAMEHYCGVFRTEDVLREGLAKVREIAQRVTHARLLDHSKVFITARIEALELENLVGAALATVASALARHESRGAHSRIDYPQRDDQNWLKHSLYFNDGRLAYKPVRMQPLTVEPFPPKARVY